MVNNVPVTGTAEPELSAVTTGKDIRKLYVYTVQCDKCVVISIHLCIIGTCMYLLSLMQEDYGKNAKYSHNKLCTNFDEFKLLQDYRLPIK